MTNSEPHRMFETQYAIQGTWTMNEFVEKHVAVCRRLFKNKLEAEKQGPVYLQEVVDLSVSMADQARSIFTLTMKGAEFHIIEMDVEI